MRAEISRIMHGPTGQTQYEPKYFLYLFSKIALIQINAGQPDVDVTQDRFMLFVVYCSLCAREACVMTDGRQRVLSRTNQPNMENERKNELFVYLNMNAAFANAPAAMKN